MKFKFKFSVTVSGLSVKTFHFSVYIFRYTEYISKALHVHALLVHAVLAVAAGFLDDVFEEGVDQTTLIRYAISFCCCCCCLFWGVGGDHIVRVLVARCEMERLGGRLRRDNRNRERERDTHRHTREEKETQAREKKHTQKHRNTETPKHRDRHL